MTSKGKVVPNTENDLLWDADSRKDMYEAEESSEDKLAHNSKFFAHQLILLPRYVIRGLKNHFVFGYHMNFRISFAIKNFNKEGH